MCIRRVADFLDTHHLEALHRKGFDVGAAEWPGRPIDRLPVLSCHCQHEQRAAWGDEAADVQDNGRT